MTATYFKTLRKHIFLHPVDRKHRSKAIKAELLKDKKKYSDNLEGALLNVKNIKVVGDRHLIVNGYSSMDVVADFQVFAPQKGQVMEGTINKRGKSHYGCLVLETFNASLSVRRAANLDPQIGDLCEFEVTDVVVDGEILFTRGFVTRIITAATTMEDKAGGLNSEFLGGVDGNEIEFTPFNISAASHILNSSKTVPFSDLKDDSFITKPEIDHQEPASDNRVGQVPKSSPLSIKREIKEPLTPAATTPKSGKNLSLTGKKSKKRHEKISNSDDLSPPSVPPDIKVEIDDKDEVNPSPSFTPKDTKKNKGKTLKKSPVDDEKPDLKEETSSNVNDSSSGTEIGKKKRKRKREKSESEETPQKQRKRQNM